jgi:hypothetical protein
MSKAEPEVHLIPKGYKGPVIIIFDDKQGRPEKYENGKRVYEIPMDGVLKTQFKKQQGFIEPNDLKYYYYDNVERHEIRYLQSTNGTTDSLSPYIFGKEIAHSTVRYLVGQLNEGDAYYKALRKNIDELFPPEVQ